LRVLRKKVSIVYDHELRKSVSCVQELRRVLSEARRRDGFWHYGCCRENDPDQ
jgi:hypothetical protein